jgi:hypothetical protein
MDMQGFHGCVDVQLHYAIPSTNTTPPFPIYPFQDAVDNPATILSGPYSERCSYIHFQTLVQIASTLVMSIIRAWLRSRRLRRDKNQLEGVARRYESDELDWQALEMVQEEISFGPGMYNYHTPHLPFPLQNTNYIPPQLLLVKVSGKPRPDGTSPAGVSTLVFDT